MAANDATQEIIDTSDTEEKELLDAEMPDYYQRIWGSPSRTQMEVDTENDSAHLPVLPRLEPRTPSHKRITSSSGIDPSPIFSRLQISPHKSHDSASATVTPATTPVGLMSNLDSSIRPPDLTTSFSSPVPSSRPLQVKSNFDSEGAWGEDVNFNDQSQDSLALLSTHTPKLEHFDKENIHEPLMSPTYSANLNHVPTFGLRHISMSPSPPLEFPHSPCASPDPISLSLVFSSNTIGPFELDSDSTHSVDYPNVTGVRIQNSNASSTGLPGDGTDGASTSTAQDTLSIDDISDANPGRKFSRVSFPLLPPSHFSLERSAQVRTESDHGIAEVPHRFRKLSLTPPPSAQPSSRRVSPTPSSSLSPAPPFPAPNPPPSFLPPFHPSPAGDRSSPLPQFPLPPDSNVPTRSYSFRNRSAIQLRPFAQEKLQYKRQLRGMPEAIVKNPTATSGRKRQERYLSGGEEDWDNQSEDQDAEDEEGNWRRRERRKEKKRLSEAVDQQLRELGIGVPSEEEDDILPEQSCGRENTTGQNVEQRSKKRKRRLKRRDFPLVETEFSPSRAPRDDLPGEDFSHPRPRPRPAFQERSPTHGSSNPAHAPSVTGPMDLDVDFGVDDAGPVDFDPSVQVPQGGRSSPILVDGVENDLDPDRERPRLDQDSDAQIFEDASDGSGDDQHGSSGEAPEMTEKDRKRIKAMGRMMPRALINKLLAKEQGKSKKKKRSETYWSEDSNADEDDAPLQPGRGRKRIVSPGSKDPKRYEIKGDPISESESERADRPEVIVLESDENGSDNTDNTLEESEEGLDAQDIQTWLAPDEVHEPDEDMPTIPSRPRKRRPDHERDRPRGGDLIDRMLQRTNRVGPHREKSAPRKERKPKVQAARSDSRFDIVTREARRHGAGGGRQTKLAFPKADKPRKSGSVAHSSRSVDQHREHTVPQSEGPREKKKLKKARRPVQTGLQHIFKSNGQKITSGRRRQYLHIGEGDDGFHEALAPEGQNARPRIRPQGDDGRDRRKNMKDILDKFRASNAGGEPDDFDMRPDGGQKHNHVTLDFGIPLLPSGLSFGTESYMGKGKLADLLSVLNNEVDAPPPLAVTTFEEEIGPDLPVSQISTLLATACDRLYDASIAPLDDPEIQLKLKASEVTMHALCQLVSFRACRDEDGKGIAAAVSVQTDHLVCRINNRLELVSADGHILDPRSFSLYWFAVELETRLAYALKRIGEDQSVASTLAAAERYAVLLLRRLLEYGLDRTMQPLQSEDPLDPTSPDVRTLELWACIFHLALHFANSDSSSSATCSFWRIFEAAMEVQSNKPDSSLDISEGLWRTMFGMCTISQFSVHGFTTSSVRLGPNWSIVSKALGCIRLSADETLDQSKPASTLKKRDKYLYLVTGRCLLLDVRYNWNLHDADVVIRELCAIFRSRNFGNLLGEPSDFPKFIWERDEPLFQVLADDDTAFGLFLKMFVRASKDVLDENGDIRPKNVGRLLRIGVPIREMSFTKTSPPIGQELSMLFNRYSAIIIAIYVDQTNIKYRVNQARQYIKFKDADHDSRVASVRAMMNLAIMLRHLNQPLDGVLDWASEMMNNLLDDYIAAEKSFETPQLEKNQLLVSIQLLLRSIRMVIENPALNRSAPRPAVYPDLALLRDDWITRIVSHTSLQNDLRTGIEIRMYIQSYLAARSKIIPPPPIPKPPVNHLESQDEYGDAGLDMDDPAVLALLDGLEEPPDKNFVQDKKAGEMLDGIARGKIFSLVYKHLSQDFNAHYPDNYLAEADQWIECWMGCASVAVRNKTRNWSFYIKMAESACDSIKNKAFRPRVFMRFMLTMLQLDPLSYDLTVDTLLQAWFASIVSSRLTIEHEFSARLFSVGALRHVLFQDLPCAPDPNTGLMTFEKPEFQRLRRSIIDAVVSNVTKRLEDRSQSDRYISYIATMLKTQRENYQSITGDGLILEEYADFCTFVYSSVRKHDRLKHAPTVHAELPPGDFS